MNKIKVSIIIPVYNVEKYINKCIDSALNQSLQEIEVIAVNDGSTDKSLEILQSYNDPRLKIITQENQGLSGARNTGIVAATGDFLLFLDSDDYIHEDMAKGMYAQALKEQSDIVICRYEQVYENGDTHYTSGITKGLSQGELFKRLLAAKLSTMACDKMYLRSLFIENDIKYPLGLYHEDVPVTYRLFYYAKKISVVEKVYYYWLRREGSISKSISEKHINDVFTFLEMTKNFLKKENVYEKYEKEFLRRVYHFIVGLIDRIYLFNNSEKEQEILIEKIIHQIHKNKYDSTDKIKKLKQYDKTLFEKYTVILASKGIELNTDNEELVEALEACKKKLLSKELELIDIYNSKGYKLIQKYYNLRDTILPIGSKRREIIKSLVNSLRSKEEIEDIPVDKIATEKVATVKKKQTNIKKEVTKPMLDVAMPITEEEIAALKTLKDKFKGKRCFIVGNGPSLNKCDLSLLENEYTFAVNGIFYKTDEMGFKPTFYMVEDGHVVDDNLKRINEYDPEYKFFPSLYKKKIIKTDNTYFFAADLGFYRGDHPSFEKPRFSKDFSEVGYCGQSVTYLNMQLAYYLGFTEVYLIGMDFSYQIRETDEVRGQTLVSNEDDVNHFHPDYFGKGKKWHDPKVHNVAKNYEFAKENFEADGRNIYNATIGGKLEIFKRADYDQLFKK